MSSRMHPDDIAAIAAQVAALLSGKPIDSGYRPPVLTIGQQALAMARQGRVEESKALLKAHSKRRAV